MKKIKVQLEYKCYPVWLYDADGTVEDTALPPELAGEHELDEKFKLAKSLRVIAAQTENPLRRSRLPCNVTRVIHPRRARWNPRSRRAWTRS